MISLLPMREDNSWQTRAAVGFGVACFAIDWEAEQATCPTGKTSAIWKPTTDNRGISVMNIRFAHTDCVACSQRSHCVSSSRSRSLTIRERPAYEAAVSARQRQTTEEFKKAYAKRAGIEGTLSQGVRMGDLRRTRYIGLPKTRLLHLLIATARSAGEDSRLAGGDASCSDSYSALRGSRKGGCLLLRVRQQYLDNRDLQ